jgi:SAM-dependent methyltransferase
MNTVAPAVVDPASYAAWRATPLGAVTETLEQATLVELIGDVRDRRVLDAGCGDGTFCRVASAWGGRVVGLDADPRMLAVARRASSVAPGVVFVQGEIESLPFADAAFDVVIASAVLCFVADARAAMREFARVLRPGGRLVLGELGRWSVWAASRRIRGWLGARPWQVARFRRASDLRALATGAGLTVDKIRGAVFYPPIGWLARWFAIVDPILGRLTTIGAAFILIRACLPHGVR